MPYTESITSITILGILMSIFMLFSQLYAISPLYQSFEKEPDKGKIILRSIIGVCLYIFFMITFSVITTTTGETYEYGLIDIKEYSLLQDNLSKYNIYFEKNNIKNEEIDFFSFELYNDENQNKRMRLIINE